MDTKSFVKILRKVVREEVQRAVKEAITEQKVSHKKVIDHGINLQRISEEQENPYSPRARKAPKKQFTKNSMLNDILNETAATGDFKSMMDGPAVTQEEWPTLGEMRTSQMVAQSMPKVVQGVNGESVDTSKQEVQTAMANITKDYSGLMKAIDKKKSGK